MAQISTYIEPPGTGDMERPWLRHGVLSVDKPDGWTSHDVVKDVRSILGLQKVGHAGTLDPHATGVLPILIGKGTKIAQYLLDWDKEYVAVLALGQRTDTQDAWGKVLKETSLESLKEHDIRSVFSSFEGTIQQVPPMYSAVKIGGQPLYKKARRGQTVDRPAKTVAIHDVEIQKLEIPDVAFRVVCSKGTYIRTLCEDIGNRLGVGGHLKWLQRRRVGPMHVDQAIGLDCLKDKLENSRLHGAFWGLDDILGMFPAAVVNGDDVRKVLHGNDIPWNRVEIHHVGGGIGVEKGPMVRVKNKDGLLLALGKAPSVQSGEGGQVLSIESVLV